MIDALTNDFTLKNVYGQQFTESGFYYNNTLVNLSQFFWFWIFFFAVFEPLLMVVGVLFRVLFSNNQFYSKYIQAMFNKPLF